MDLVKFSGGIAGGEECLVLQLGGIFKKISQGLGVFSKKFSGAGGIFKYYYG